MIETGVYFDEIHSFYDLDLILSSVDIPPAQPKTFFVDIAGSDGSLDLTEAHGAVKYNDRDITFVFTASPAIPTSDWEEHRTTVCNALNGRRCKITLDKDDEYYYSGRLSVSGINVNKRLRQITVKARVNPWKLKQFQTVVEVALDATARTVLLTNSRRTVCPVIECTNDDTMLTYNGTTYSLSAGVHKILDIQLTEGANAVAVSGSGVIKFTYQEGAL